MEKVLLACPINEVKHYCIHDWIENILKIQSDFDIYLVDNSHDENFHKSLREKYALNIDHVKPIGRNVDYMRDSQNLIRNHFLSGGYTHLFSLECDIFVPADVINYLLCHDKDFIALPYFISSGEGGRALMAEIENNFWLRTNRKIPPEESFLKHNGKMRIQTDTGLGCALIKRNVMEQIMFKTAPSINVHADSYFHMEMFERGIEAYYDTSFVLEHRNGDWGLVADFSNYN